MKPSAPAVAYRPIVGALAIPILRSGDEYVLDGRTGWISSAPGPRERQRYLERRGGAA